MRISIGTLKWPGVEQVLSSLTPLQYEIRFIVAIRNNSKISLPGSSEENDIDVSLADVTKISIFISQTDGLEVSAVETELTKLISAKGFSPEIVVKLEQ